MSCAQPRDGFPNTQQAMLAQFRELQKGLNRQTERIDGVNVCLSNMAGTVSKLMDEKRDLKLSPVAEEKKDPNFGMLIGASLQPILDHLQTLESQVEKLNATRRGYSDERTLGTTSINESDRLRDDLVSVQLAIVKAAAENSELQAQIRADLADLSRDIHAKFEEHLPVSSFLAKLTSRSRSSTTPRLATAPENAKITPRLKRGVSTGMLNSAMRQPTPSTQLLDGEGSARVQQTKQDTTMVGVPRQIVEEQAPEPAPEPPDTYSPSSLMCNQNEIMRANKLAMRNADEEDTGGIGLKMKVAKQPISTVFIRDDDVAKQPFDPLDYYSRTGWAQAIARSSAFEKITDLMIVLNAIYLGIESNYNDETNQYRAFWMFQVATQFFAIYFCGELLIRFLAYEERRTCLKDGWFKFDFVLVSVMIIDVWMIEPLLLASDSSHRSKFQVQPVRLLRLIKLVRIVRLVEVFPELVLMTKALVRSFRAITSTLIIVSLTLYSCSIFLHTLLRHKHDLNQQLKQNYDFSFDTLANCSWTLLVCGVLQLDNTALIMTALMEGNEFSERVAGFIFTLFSLMSALLILQMLIGVLCDVISRIGQEQRNAEAIALVRQEVLGELLSLDVDNNGTISQDGLRQVLNSSHSRALLKKLKINRLFFCELANMLFVTPGQTVSIKIIMELLILCRGDNATNVDILASSFCFMTAELVEMENRLLASILHVQEWSQQSGMVRASKLLADSGEEASQTKSRTV